MANWTQKLKLQHLKMLVALGEQGNQIGRAHV